MAEPSLADYIALNYSMVVSLVFALVGAGILDPSDIAAACRSSAETTSSELVESRLLAFAERWEAAQAGAERLFAPGWKPEVIPGGKDGGGEDVGGEDGGGEDDA
jgi:hypothetical protein